MDKNKIPDLTFRIEPGYTFEQELKAPEPYSQNILIGELPAGSELNAIFLGKIAEYGKSKNIWLDCEGAHAVYVMGKRRSGKTYTLGVILEGLASNNWIKQGNKQQAIVMIDTMNVFITMPHNVEEVYGGKSKELEELKRWGLEKENFNIILFYPRGTLPPPEGNSKEIAIKPSDLSAQDWTALFGFDTYSDPMGQLISDLYEKVVLEGYDDIRGNRIDPKKDYSIDDLLNCIDNCQVIASGYHPDTIRAVKARFKAIKRLQIFSETGINLKEIFSPGQISILLLRDLEQNLRSLLVGILVKKIMEFRSISDKCERLASVHEKRFRKLKEQGVEGKAREEYQKYEEYMKEAQKGLPRGWIIIDEAHNYIPAKGITPSAEPLKKYVNEGRNLGLSIVVATQNPSALDPSIRRNADILIIHSISMRDDISTAEGMINTFLPDSFEFGRERITSRVFEQLVRSLPLGYAVISNDRVNRVFVAKIRPRITVHGGLEY
jgi:DNA helicase HerA-like ATPase